MMEEHTMTLPPHHNITSSSSRKPQTAPQARSPQSSVGSASSPMRNAPSGDRGGFGNPAASWVRQNERSSSRFLVAMQKWRTSHPGVSAVPTPRGPETDAHLLGAVVDHLRRKIARLNANADASTARNRSLRSVVDRFDCAVCLSTATNAVELPCCGCLGCESCFCRLAKCPLCRSPISHPLPPALTVRRCIHTLVTRCPHCRASMEQGAIRDHTARCAAAQRACPYGCGFTAKSPTAVTMHTDGCPLRRAVCVFCGLPVSSPDIVQHVASCGAVRIRCDACGAETAREHRCWLRRAPPMLAGFAVAFALLALAMVAVVAWAFELS
eukprot:TRINITY_DN22565_c0_g1_i1.p1 TRINITY_DN22565_c0_g1~~TRINITY_DN22565_c0_g1_i1.p1  ORF type:complete len:326 (+),score=29.31 TRINITY_DN22565_c0_g1_i1:252-1229(+)